MTRVLLVEDDVQFSEAVQNFLRDSGHEVWVADSAQEAHDTMLEFNFDVVIADFDLGPGMPHGLTVLKAAAATEPRTKTILWSGLDRSEEISLYGFTPDKALLKSDIRQLEEAIA